jgi:hypothetical protein
MASENVSVVLAHGAWADGSSWSKVIGRLNAAGIPAVAAPLPLTSLGDDVAAVTRMIARTVERTPGPVVLAGHAYAGAVIGAVRHKAVRALVYAAALAPDEGETVADVFYRGETHPLAPKLAPDSEGWIWLPHEAFAAAFAQDAAPEELAVLAAVQRPIAAACIGEPVGRPLWRELPAWYLVAGQDRMIDPATQHFMARRMNANVRTCDADHTPLVTAPDAVAQVIVEATRAAAAQ